jgi:hypothetical protein
MDSNAAAGLGIGLILLIIIVSIAVYLIPTFIAFKRGKANKGAVLAINLFLGWSLIGWVVALVWALKVDVIDKM